MEYAWIKRLPYDNTDLDRALALLREAKRCRIAWLPLDRLAKFHNGGECPYPFEFLPGDLGVVGFHCDKPQRRLGLKFHSATYDPVPEGMEYPEMVFGWVPANNAHVNDGGAATRFVTLVRQVLTDLWPFLKEPEVVRGT